MARPCVLVVDDEFHIRQLITRKLAGAGVDCESASNGNEALTIAARITPTMVVTDFQMPGMDGLELARRLATLENTAETPVIILTARGHRMNTSELTGANVHAVMDKPFSPRQLLGAITELIEATVARDGNLSDDRPAEAA